MKNTIKSIRQPKILRIIVIAIVCILSFVGLLYFEYTKDRVAIENSMVSAPIINVSPATPGKLTDIKVYENENIQKGDPIAVVGGQTLYADTEALVIMANNQIGSIASPQAPVAQLINPSEMRIAGTIDENKGLNDIKVGQVASFTVDALSGETFWGYVDEISPSAKQTQASFSISSERPTQQFVVYARFDAKKYPEIKNGMSAKMTVYTK